MRFCCERERDTRTCAYVLTRRVVDLGLILAVVVYGDHAPCMCVEKGSLNLTDHSIYRVSAFIMMLAVVGVREEINVGTNQPPFIIVKSTDNDNTKKTVRHLLGRE